MFKHDRDDPFQHRTVDLQARIVVDLNQPGLELPVNDKIQPKNLEVIPQPSMINSLVISLNYITRHFLQLRPNIPLNIIVPRRMTVV